LVQGRERVVIIGPFLAMDGQGKLVADVTPAATAPTNALRRVTRRPFCPVIMVSPDKSRGGPLFGERTPLIHLLCNYKIFAIILRWGIIYRVEKDAGQPFDTAGLPFVFETQLFEGRVHEDVPLDAPVTIDRTGSGTRAA
jgi:hypothetical protein